MRQADSLDGHPEIARVSLQAPWTSRLVTAPAWLVCSTLSCSLSLPMRQCPSLGRQNWAGGSLRQKRSQNGTAQIRRIEVNFQRQVSTAAPGGVEQSLPGLSPSPKLSFLPPNVSQTVHAQLPSLGGCNRKNTKHVEAPAIFRRRQHAHTKSCLLATQKS